MIKLLRQNLFMLVLLVGVSTSARHQIPFGFFRTSGVSIVDSFESWSGAPSLPSGWSDNGSNVMYPSRYPTNFTHGIYALNMGHDNSGTGDMSNIVKTFDLTGVTQMIYDYTYKFSPSMFGTCEIHFRINGVLVSTTSDVQSNVTVNIAVHAGASKT